MKKRILSILLALAMLITMIPLMTMTAFADEQLTIESYLMDRRLPVRSIFGNRPPFDSWKTPIGKSAFLSESMSMTIDGDVFHHYSLTFNYNEKEVSIPWDTPLVKSRTYYRCTTDDGITCTFNDFGNYLTSIEVEGSKKFNGTYTKRILAPVDTAVENLASIKISAQKLIGDALGDGTAPVVGAYFDAGLEAVAKANTIDEVKEAAYKYIGLIYESKAVVETRISQNKLKANKNGKIVVSFKAPELKPIVGYVVQRATDKNFSKNVKTFNTKKTSFTNTKNLKKGRRYYYQVYAKVQLSDGKIVTTNLSNIRYIKCKKTR